MSVLSGEFRSGGSGRAPTRGPAGGAVSAAAGVPAEGSGEGFYGQDVLTVPLAAEFADGGDQGDEKR